jgi:hypothetical protein
MYQFVDTIPYRLTSLCRHDTLWIDIVLDGCQSIGKRLTMGRGLSDLQKQILCYVYQAGDGEGADWLDALHPREREKLRERLADSVRPDERFEWTRNDTVALSLSLRRLEARGLVESVRGERRIQQVKLTPYGKKVAHQLYRLTSTNDDSKMSIDRPNRPVSKESKPTKEKPSLRDAVIKVLLRGKRNSTRGIADLVDSTTKQVASALISIERNPPMGMMLLTGGGSHLLFNQPAPGTPAAVALDAMPLIGECLSAIWETKDIEHPTKALDLMRKLLRMLEGSVPTAKPLIEECIEILPNHPVGRQISLAREHLSEVRWMLDALLTRTKYKPSNRFYDAL